VLIVCALFAGASLPAAAQDSELNQLKEKLKAMEQTIQQMKQQIADMEKQKAAAPAVTTNIPPSQSACGQKLVHGGGSTNAAAARQFANEQYQRDVEWREGVRFAESPFRERIEQVLQDFVEFHGYFRAGYGRDDQGGPQTAFQAPGAFAKYRLGNEAENYGEIMFGKNFYLPNLFSMDPQLRPDGTPTGPIARVETMISIFNPYQELLSSGGTDFGLPELFASIGNVVAAQPSMKFWAGSRYYRRQDIHINDFFYYNMSGRNRGC